MGPPVYSRPPQVGRPVIFLERKGTSKQKANGTALNQNGNGEDKRVRSHTNRESRRDKKNRSRSQSRSRSLGPEMLTRRHSDTLNKSAAGVSGNIILQKKIEDTRIFSKSLNQVRRSDNNNQFATYSIAKSTILPTTNIQSRISEISATELAKNTRYAPERERYSITQINTNSSINPAYLSQILFQERERTIIFRDESDDILLTPKKDYPHDSPGSSEVVQMPRVDTINSRMLNNVFAINIGDTEDTPGADYLHEIVSSNQKLDNFEIKSGEIDDIIALSPQFTNYRTGENGNETRNDNKTSRHRQNLNFVTSPSLPSDSRPLTPPFDGADAVFPFMLSLAQPREGMPSAVNNGFRIPTPPPDMSPDKEYSPLRGQNFHIPPPPPPPPPLPIGNTKYKSPQPGLSHSLNNLLNTSKPPTANIEGATQKTSTENQSRDSVLPFMEELKRRQRSIDEGNVMSPLTGLIPPTVSSLSNGHQQDGAEDNHSNNSNSNNSQISESPKHGLPHRISIVQFANDPPEIIPHDTDYNFNTHGGAESPMHSIMDTSFPPPPPPLPPPLPHTPR